ncbi:MAG: type II secretion system protein GspM [Sphingomonadales bacterium]
MTLTFSSVLSRGLALGVLAAMLAALWFVAVSPLIHILGDQRTNLTRLQTRLLETRQSGSRRGDLRKKLEALRADPILAASFVEANTRALAAAWLQESLKKTVGAQGGSLTSIQPLPAQAEGAFRTVGVRAIMTVNIEQLHKIVHALENNVPVLVVRDVSIRTDGARNARPAAVRDAQLTVRMDVQAYSKLARR